MLCSYPDYASVSVPEAVQMPVKDEPADDSMDMQPPLPAGSSRVDQPAASYQNGPAALPTGSIVSADGTVTFQGSKFNILELQAEVVCV